jgi:competence protein ComEA
MRMNPFLHDTVARSVIAGGLSLAMAATAHALDVNTASAQQLEALRGVGPKTAQIIVQERLRGGQFESIEDLSDRVRGIGPKKAQALQAAGLTVGGGSGVAKPPPARHPTSKMALP